jgi:predicted RNA binding protein YcfA (HicA-like mRNA interferase family)
MVVIHLDGKTATVPDHKGEDLGRGITNKILHEPFYAFLLKRLNC